MVRWLDIQWFAVSRKHALLIVSDYLYYNKFKNHCKVRIHLLRQNVHEIYLLFEPCGIFLQGHLLFEVLLVPCIKSHDQFCVIFEVPNPE